MGNALRYQLFLNGKRYRKAKLMDYSDQGGETEPLYGGEEEPIGRSTSPVGLSEIQIEIVPQANCAEYTELRRLQRTRQLCGIVVKYGTFVDAYKECTVQPASRTGEDGHSKLTVTFRALGVPIKRAD
jgi:hypothetical protein